jgi:NitT/TauT family transport system permease protein
MSGGWALGLGLLLPLLLMAGWTGLTWGEPVESRWVSPVILPSPFEVAGSFPSLWFERALMRSVVYSLGRVLAGFAIAAVLAVPLGIAMGAWSPMRALVGPMMSVGGYVPIAALVPLTLSWFGTGETQKVFFLAMASFVMLLPLVVQAVDDVDEVYLKTAYTLGAGPWQAVRKVLLPISAPAIFDGLRLTFGIGWTYILLAEIVAAERGLGNLIIVSQRRGPREHVYLVLLVIVLLAFGTDKLMERLGRLLFPFRAGSKR